MKLILIHGNKKSELDIAYETKKSKGSDCSESTSDCQTDEWTVLRLKKEIEKLLNVEACHQRLIHKGKTIIGDDLPLTKLKLKSGDKIMVLTGSKPVEVSEDMKHLLTVEKIICSKLRVKLAELESKLDGIEKGYVPAELLGEALNSFDKQQRHFAEECMSILEELDGIAIGEDAISSVKIKRKCLVQDVQNLLSQYDNMVDRLNYVKSEPRKADALKDSTHHAALEKNRVEQNQS